MKPEIVLKIRIITECFCAHYLHEMTNYPREGLVEKKFSVGEELLVEKRWSNFYGIYYRCILPNGDYADIRTCHAEIVETE